MLQKSLPFILYLVLISLTPLSYSLSPSFSFYLLVGKHAKITIVTTTSITATNIIQLGTQTMFVIDSQVRWGSLLHIKSRNDNYNIGCYNKVKEARCKKKPKKRRGMSCCCKFKLGNGIAKCFGVF